MKKIISLFMTFVLLISLSACGTRRITAAEEPDSEFTEFLNDFIIETAESDYITMHQYFENPEKYGIDSSKATITLGSFVSEDSEEESDLDERFEEFDIADLDKTQQLIYRQLEYYSELNDRIDDEKFDYLPNIWSSTNGTHQMLVQFFSEYTLRHEEDIEPLITLLKDVPRYTRDALEYSDIQAEKNLLMFDYDQVIEDCQTILDSKDDSAVVKELNEEVEALNLSEDKEETYKIEIKDAIDTYFYPSFETIMDGLSELSDEILPLQGLSNLKNGKEYYEYLVADATGSDDSVRTIQNNLEEDINDCVNEFYSLDDDAISDSVYASTSFQSIEEILNFLETNYKREFPELKNIDYDAIPLAEEQSQEGIMAYFLIPAIDNTKPYRIRYNEVDYGSEPSSIELYSTFAHEGLPGHMYQSQYNHERFEYPIQFMLNNIGFTEGYATYIEMESLNFLDLDEDTKKAYILNTVITNDYISLMDLDIHYKGMSLDDFTNKYSDLFGPDLEDLYNQLADMPSAFLSYYYGYYKIQDLKEQAMNQLGSDFNTLEFHDALLQAGSAPFSIIEKNISYYIKEKR